MKVRAEVIRVESQGSRVLVQAQAPIRGGKDYGVFTLFVPPFLAKGYYLGRILTIIVRPR